ncbi:MAG: hypothetical protein JWQ44_1136 [Chthoniobacter sp.]|jgi:uncharacterized membrane protein|nr:hypothetical protein [Chthoniobacter sp.]
MPSIPSPLARNAEALSSVLWPLFLLWSVVVAALWTSLVGTTQISESVGNPGLRSAFIFLVQIADPVWFTLAGAVLYLQLVEGEGLRTARRWALVILGTAAVIAVSSAWSAFPLGPVRYTTRLGMKLGPVPFGWPLLWFVVLVSARQLATNLAGRASPAVLALITAAIASLTSFNLEPIAKLRAFWLWFPSERTAAVHPPWQNHVTWFVTAALLTWLLRPEWITPRAVAHRWRPALVLVTLNALCLATHLRLLIRG